jgi:hypothetical protein
MLMGLFLFQDKEKISTNKYIGTEKYYLTIDDTLFYFMGLKAT